MKNINLKHLKGEYKISIEKGIFTQINDILSNYSYQKCVIITDENINKIYKEQIAKIDAELIVIKPGEDSKTMEVYEEVIEKLIESNFDRKDMLIALGGGVVGDLTGFIAATLLRGVRFVQVPTTLLAQVDSSIGGKVAINSKFGKNLIGNFYHPEEVIIDPEFLLTLPDREIKSGLGELIKHGAIKDKDLFERVLKLGDFDNLYVEIEDILEKSLNIKKEVVQLDEHDTGIRMILNFGHTIGHGIEKSTDIMEMAHGEAVALGMIEMTKLTEANGLTEKGSLDKLSEIFDKFDMNQKLDYKMEDIFKYLRNDKKIFNGKINIIVLKEIGKVEIVEYSIDEFKKLLGVN